MKYRFQEYLYALIVGIRMEAITNKMIDSIPINILKVIPILNIYFLNPYYAIFF